MRGLLTRIFGRDTSERPSYPGIPEGVAVYVIGDVHGCLDPLKKTLAAIDRDVAESRPSHAAEIFLGDYIDRGPDSAGVLELLSHRSATRPAIFIKGNHDAMMVEFAQGERTLAEWLPYGGAETLRSYGATREMIASDAQELPALITPRHVDFLSRCEYSFEVEGYLFAHAGVRPGVALHNQSPQDLMWIRDEFLNHRGDFGAVVVHGHTPVEAPEFRGNRIGIDTGCYMTGRLTCLRIDGSGPRVLQAGD